MWLFGEGFGDRHCSLETVSSFLDSALRNREMQRVEAHLASCSECAQHAEEMKAVVGVLRMMPTEPAPRSFAIPVPARVFVAEPSRPWWRPAPMVGLRAMAAAAAIALAVVFAGDMTGAIGTATAPIQTGNVESSDLVGVGDPPGPERPQFLGPAPVPDPAPGDAGATDIPGTETTPQPDATLTEHSWFRFELWPLELGLLALTAAMAGISVLLRRRTTSS